MTARIEQARLFSLAATPKTVWLFVELVLDDGRSGWGEASLAEHEAAVRDAAEIVLAGLAGRTLSSPEAMTAALPFDTLASAALSSAVAQALWDLDAQLTNVSLAERLGGRRRERIGLYANINRRTRDRSVEGVAASAGEAWAAGFRALKIAPFDEVRRDLTRAEMRAAMEPGLARAFAIREALGPDIRLMLDCHWRFDVDGARELTDACRDLAPYWIECPVDETPGAIDAIKSLRARANGAGIKLAGLETQILADGFRPYVLAGAYDVMMPDVKYAGGPAEMLRIADFFASHNVAFSPHNPTGPICHMHSLHVCAALPDSDLLEHQFDETPVFGSIVGGDVPPVHEGAATPEWSRPGLGIALHPESGAAEEVSFSAGDLQP